MALTLVRANLCTPLLIYLSHLHRFNQALFLSQKKVRFVPDYTGANSDADVRSMVINSGMFQEYLLR